MTEQLTEGRQLTDAELADALTVLRQRMPPSLTWDINHITDLARLTWGEELEWYHILDKDMMCADPTDWEKLGIITDSNFINGVYYMWALLNQVDSQTASRVILEMQRQADANAKN
jgi:hypothetical protein